MPAGRDEGGGSVRSRFGVIALTPGHTKVALVRRQQQPPGPSSPGGSGGGGGAAGSAGGAGEGWQFPSALPAREAERLEDQLEMALRVADEQLGLDVAELLCSQPVIHALGPEPRVSTKFFMAFNVPEDSQLKGGEGQVAEWVSLQTLQEETAEQQVTGNQLVAVLRQLQGMIKRRYEMIMPADDGYQEVAALMSWHEAVQNGEISSGGLRRWSGVAPKDFLEQHCRANKLPAPCFNVFEHDRTPTGRTHFCATCLLPHLGLQLTPDAVYPSPLDALENAAVLAVLYLQGALAPDCPLVHFAAAGEMAQVPHAFVTEHEVRQDARQQQGHIDRKKRELERQVEEEQAALQRRMAELKRQQQMLAAGDIPGLQAPPRSGGPGVASAAVAGSGGPAGAPALLAGGERAAKRPRPDKGPIDIGVALQQIPRDKHPLMAIKELCDKCRFPLPLYEELPAAGGTTKVSITLSQAGIARTVGPPHEDRKQSKVLAAQIVLEALRKKHVGAA